MIAAGTATVLAMAGCGGGSQPDIASDGQRLSIQTPWDETSPYQAPFEKIVAEFEQSTGVQVEVQHTSNDQNQQIFTTKVLSQEEPDIIFTNPTRDALSWVEQGATVAVSDYVDEWGLDEIIYQEALTAVNWLTDDGQLRGFPLGGFVWPTWYLTGDLEAAGGAAPVGRSDVEDFVAGLDGDSVVVGGADWSGFNALLMTLQVYLSDDELNFLAAEGGWSSDEAARKGVAWFVELRDLGFWSPNSTGQTVDGANAAFQGGQAAGITLISDYFADVPEDLAADITLGGIPVPDDAAVASPVVMSAFTGSGPMISERGAQENLDVIKDFVTFLYTPSSLGTLVAEGGMIVAGETGGGTAGEGLLAQANSTEFRDSVTFVGASDIPTDIVENLTRAASIAWTTGATVDDILAALDSAY